MISVDELIQSSSEPYMKAVQLMASRMHVSMPCVVVSYDPQKQTINAQPAIKTLVAGEYKQLPMLLDVPVYFPGGASSAFTFSIHPGDECLVMFADACIDSWYQRGDVQLPDFDRHHDLSDGFALVGYRSMRTVVQPDDSYTMAFRVKTSKGWQTAIGVNQDGTVVANIAGGKQEASFVTPEMFGAVGNGRTNDIQALRQAAAHGYVLLTKRYYVYGELSLDNCYLLGGQILLRGYIAVGDNVTISHSRIINYLNGTLGATKPVIRFAGSNSTVQHTQFVGENLPGGRTQPGMGYSFRGLCMAILCGSKYTTVSHCTFGPFFKQDMRINGDDVLIEDCTFQEHTSTTMSNLQSGECGIKISSYDLDHPGQGDADGGFMTIPNGKNVRIQGCYLYNHGDNPIDSFTGAQNVIIDSCYIDCPGHRCIEIKTKNSIVQTPTGAQPRWSRNYIISNCTLMGHGILVASVLDYEAQGQLDEITVSNCRCINYPTNEFGTATRAFNLTTRMSLIDNCYIDCGGTVFTGVHSDLRIRNCTIVNASTMIPVAAMDGAIRRFDGCTIDAATMFRVEQGVTYYITGCKIHSSGNAFTQAVGNLFISDSELTLDDRGVVITSDSAKVSLTNCGVHMTSAGEFASASTSLRPIVRFMGVRLVGTPGTSRITFEPDYRW